MGTMHEVGYWEGAINENTPCKPQSQYALPRTPLRQSNDADAGGFPLQAALAARILYHR